MHNLFVDYETFWDVGYSLRSPKISTTDYILDKRFAVHGASVAWNQDVPQWMDHGKLEDLFAELKWNNEDVRFVGHHTLFDGYITKYVFDYEDEESISAPSD